MDEINQHMKKTVNMINAYAASYIMRKGEKNDARTSNFIYHYHGLLISVLLSPIFIPF